MMQIVVLKHLYHRGVLEIIVSTRYAMKKASVLLDTHAQRDLSAERLLVSFLSVVQFAQSSCSNYSKAIQQIHKSQISYIHSFFYKKGF